MRILKCVDPTMCLALSGRAITPGDFLKAIRGDDIKALREMAPRT